MISGMITLGFIGLVVFLGKYLFSVGDWGKPTSEPPCGPGMKFPPVPRN